MINHKLFTGKYLIYETNGFSKEYNSYNDKLCFESEYKNEERNGKGKEYSVYDNLKGNWEYLLGNGKEYNHYSFLSLKVNI